MKRPQLQTLIAFILLLSAAWGLRAPFLAREFWSLDEGSTFTMAMQVRRGAVLYRDATDNRSPLMPYVKAAVFAVAGDWNIRAQHLALALALGVGAFGLLNIATRMGHRAAGYWSAGAFTFIVYLWPGVLDSLGAHTESFVILFSILGFWLFARALPRGGFVAGLGIGLAFAASSLCKQPGALDFGVSWVVLALLAWRQPSDRRRLGALWAGSVVAFASAWGLTCLYFAAHGAWDDFVYYAWTFNTRLYVPEVPLPSRILKIRMMWDLALAWMPAALFVGLGGVALAVGEAARSLARRSRPLPVLPLVALGWLLAGTISVGLSGRYFQHYVIQAAPGLSLLCGWALARVSAWFGTAGNHRGVRVLGWSILTGLVLWTLHDVTLFWRRVERHDDPGNAALRALVQRETSPTERILVWGYYPEAYAICRRLPATRFIYTNYLTGMIPWTNLAPEIDTRYAVKTDAWAAFWRDYAARPPRLILDSAIRGYSKYPLLSQARLRDEVIAHFAEIRPESARGLPTRIFKRLVSPDEELAAATPSVDPQIALDATRESGQSDLVAVMLAAPVGTTDVALRLDGKIYRQLRCLPDLASSVRFLVPVADLATHGTVVDFVLRHEGQFVATKSLDVARRLVLDLRRPSPTPVLGYGTQQLPPVGISTPEKWTSAVVANREGWRHDGGFELTFDRPPAMHVLQFSWLPPSSTLQTIESAAPAPVEVRFDSTLVASEQLPLKISPGPAGLQEISVELPRGDPGKLILRSNDIGTVWLGNLRGSAHGPVLRFGEREIQPSLAVQNDQERLTLAADGSWDAHPFARLFYPREPGMEGVVIEFGIREDAYTSPVTGNPPHVIMEINFLHEDGRHENLMTRDLDPVQRPEDRGLQTAEFSLPAQGTGEIEIRFVSPNRGNPNDRAYVRRLRARGSGPDLMINADNVLVPLESQTPGDYRIHVKSPAGWIAHAPSMVAYACPPNLRAITFGFGLDENAYWDEHHRQRSDGIDAIVELIEPNGNVTHLYKRSLDPFNQPADRGIQRARVELPGRAGRLIIRLTPGRFSSDAFDWSYLTDIVGETNS